MRSIEVGGCDSSCRVTNGHGNGGDVTASIMQSGPLAECGYFFTQRPQRWFGREREDSRGPGKMIDAHGPKGIGMAPPYCVCEVPGTAFALLAVALWGGNGAVAPTIWAHGS